MVNNVVLPKVKIVTHCFWGIFARPGQRNMSEHSILILVLLFVCCQVTLSLFLFLLYILVEGEVEEFWDR